MPETAGEKTESATPQRRREARQRGQVAKSTDLSSIGVLLGLILALRGLCGHAASVLTLYLQSSYRHLDSADLTIHQTMTLGSGAVMALLQALGPMLLLAMALGVGINVAQTGPLWAMEALTPKLDKLNPLTGIQRLVSMRGVFELGKSVYKIGLISYICWATIRGAYPDLCNATRMDLMGGASVVGDTLVRLALRVATVMLVLAALDYAYQRFQFEKQMRMSKEEVKREYKQNEVSPQLKARIRARQREMAKKRMMNEVPTADVIITNPTHFAIALRYESGKMVAPTVVAKGQDFIALKIREQAQAHDVPIVENPPLARALYAQVKVGGEVPGDLYEAVAEVLAFVYQINRERRERAGLTL